MSIMPYPPGQDPRHAILARPQPDWPEEEPDPDAVVDDLRWRWRRGSFPPPVPGFDLAGGVGRGTRNARADVARLETLLHRAGHYDVSGTGGPTGYFGPPQEDAIRAYQKARGLTVDGLVLPNGETMAALAREPEARPPDGQADTNEGSSEATGNRAPPDQEGNAGAIIGGGALVGTALVSSALWQQEQERQRKAGKPASRPNLLDFSLPRPANIFNGAPVPKANRDIVKDDTPTHTGHSPPEVPDTSILSGPGTPMPVEQLPPTIRPDLKKEDFVEIFPDQSGELPQLIVNEANQNEQTKKRITDYAQALKEAGGSDVEIYVGGYGKDGVYRTERILNASGVKGTRGGVFPDIILFDKRTGVRVYVNDASTYADGERLKPREERAALRIFEHKEKQDYGLTLPKPGEGREFDIEALKKHGEAMWQRIRSGAAQPVREHWNILKPG